MVAENINDPFVQEYVSPNNINQMHKVVMQVNDEEQLRKLHTTLEDKQIVHRMWVEQPENFPTGKHKKYFFPYSQLYLTQPL